MEHRHRISHYCISELCEETAGGGADDNIIITMVSENPKNTPTYAYGEEFKLLGGYSMKTLTLVWKLHLQYSVECLVKFVAPHNNLHNSTSIL